MSNLWTRQVPKATVDIQGEMVKHILHSMKFSSSLQNDITAASCCMRLKLIQIIGACQQLWIFLTNPTSCLTYLRLNFRFMVNQWKHVYLICNMFGQCRVGPPLFSGSLNVSLNNSKLACSTTPLICNLFQMWEFFVNNSIIRTGCWKWISRFKYSTDFFCPHTSQRVVSSD